jgi:hypothetical protein
LDKEKLAAKVSDIFNPLYISFVFFLIVSLHVSSSLLEAAKYWLVAGFFFCVLPLGDVLLRIRKGITKDIHIDERKDRIIPFLITLTSSIVGLLTVSFLGFPKEIQAVSWAIVLTGGIITVITLFWKISLHAAGISAIATALIVFLGLSASVLVLFIPVVFWARITLRKHNIWQLLAGSGLSVLIMLFVLNWYGLL